MYAQLQWRSIISHGHVSVKTDLTFSKDQITPRCAALPESEGYIAKRRRLVFSKRYAKKIAIGDESKWELRGEGLRSRLSRPNLSHSPLLRLDSFALTL